MKEFATLGQKDPHTLMQSLLVYPGVSLEDSDAKRNAHSRSLTHKFSVRKKKVSIRN